MIRLVIADDHAAVRRAVQEIVRDEGDLCVVGEAQNAEEILAFMRTHDADVIVLDISLPGRSGLEVLRQLQYEHPGVPVLVMSVHDESPYAVYAMKAGAAGYVPKQTAPDELVRAIRTVVSGMRYVSPSFGELMSLGLARMTPVVPWSS
jgi:two-component system, NarL family, invasion response regulator UvrY